ncbi:hypothetical protein ACLOJK_021834 [Asimina triloba]
MMRRHGWQLPAHTLQVVAITVFFLLVIAFYAFFAPFLGGQILEYAAIAIYTPVVLAVFILYVRCTAINPADPGVLESFDGKNINKSMNNLTLQGSNLPSVDSSPSSAARSSMASDVQNRTPTGEERIDIPTYHTSRRPVSCLSVGVICALFVQEDCCKHGASEAQADGEGALFCTLCNVELLIECGVGLAVFVRCFTDRKGMEHHIVDQLGNGFSIAPFASVVVCAPFATVVGLTTYEYVVAMRAMSEPPEGSVTDDNQNVLYSPTASATTGLSGRSSLSQQYKAAWCTPPRVFADDQDEVIHHLDPGIIPSIANPDASGFTDRGNKLPKRPIKRSAWKLAKLDPNEAMKAAAKARASSSVLRPLGSSQLSQANASSSSRHSNVSTEFGINNEMKNDMKLSPAVHSCPPSHVGSEGYERSMSSSSTPSHSHVAVVLDSPVEHPADPPNTVGTAGMPPDQSLNSRQSLPNTNLKVLNPIHQSNSTSDNQTMQKKIADVLGASSSGQLPSLAREGRRVCVVWDQEAGRYVSVSSTARSGTAVEIPVQSLLQSTSANPPMETSSHSRRRTPLSEPSMINPPLRQPERLMYGEQSPTAHQFPVFISPTWRSRSKASKRQTLGISRNGTWATALHVAAEEKRLVVGSELEKSAKISKQRRQIELSAFSAIRLW